MSCGVHNGAERNLNFVEMPRRLGFIEFWLFWEGHVTRDDLKDSFGISVNQASTDLDRYLGIAPDKMTYDSSGKAYVRCSELAPQFVRPDASRHLPQLRSLSEGIIGQTETWIRSFPTFDATPIGGQE
jgi:hypothetical protein